MASKVLWTKICTSDKRLACSRPTHFSDFASCLTTQGPGSKQQPRGLGVGASFLKRTTRTAVYHISSKSADPFPPDQLEEFCRQTYTVSQKNCAKLFCQNFVKFPPILIIFGRKMAKRLKLCELHSFSTSPNSRHHTTVLNADVQNCYTSL